MGTENILGVPRDLGVGKGLIRKEMHKEILGVVKLLCILMGGGSTRPHLSQLNIESMHFTV